MVRKALVGCFSLLAFMALPAGAEAGGASFRFSFGFGYRTYPPVYYTVYGYGGYHRPYYAAYPVAVARVYRPHYVPARRPVRVVRQYVPVPVRQVRIDAGSRRQGDKEYIHYVPRAYVRR